MKAREFWIDVDDKTDWLECMPVKEFEDQFVHVIEKSAADKLDTAISDAIVAINDQCDPDSDGMVSMDYEFIRLDLIKALKEYRGEE